MEENKEYKIYHKVEAGRKIRVFKNTYNDRNYYRVQVKQKNYDNTEDIFYVPLQFKKGVELENQTDIIIKEAYENMRKNPKDEYNQITYLVITDFEIVEREEQIQAQAYKDFQDNLFENEQEDMLESSLPF
jgi:hypothetical protein